MIEDDKHHGGASEEDGERVELVVCYHFGCDGAFDGRREFVELAIARLTGNWAEQMNRALTKPRRLNNRSAVEEIRVVCVVT